MLSLRNPIISVVLCVYNGEKYIRDAIHSILNQSFTDFEFIIVNDGSEDKTEEIILSFGDPRIVYVKNEVNLKLIKSLNKGVDLAKGQFIARMDADDIAFPDRFKKQVEVFELYPGVDIVNANVYLMAEDGKKFREQKSLTFTPSFEAIRFLINLQNFIFHPAVMVKADLLKKYKYLDDFSREHIEDYDLWVRMLNDGRLCYTLEDRVMLYRDNSLSINHNYRTEQLERMFILSTNVLKENLNFSFNEKVFRILLAEGGEVDGVDVDKLNTGLAAYNLFVKRKFNISATGFKEMEIWRKQKIITIVLKSLKCAKLKHKISLVKFLISRIGWLFNKNILILLKRTLYTKYWTTSFMIDFKEFKWHS